VIKLGEKIKALRKQKNISQEILANYLGVSYQAVSKWENETTMPDVTLIPAIASFFGVSTDELFDFNLFETEMQVKKICDEACKYRYSDGERAEKILRNGLKRFPGNHLILNNLLYTLDFDTRGRDVVDICTTLIENSKGDEIKYDACRILASYYKANGKYELIKPTLNKIPELYFTKLELMASLLNGEDMFAAAHKQKNLSAETLIDMLICLAKYYKEKGDTEKAKIQLTIAKTVIDAFAIDFVESDLFIETVYEYSSGIKEEINSLLCDIEH